MRAVVVAALLFVTVAANGSAQDSVATAARDSLFQRAQRLVNEGKGDEGRGLVDSLLRVSAPGTAAHADGLFWRASLATTSAEAERDYRQITVDYPTSQRSEDALLRLAQLELQRGDRPLAIGHLERLLREHGDGPARARAGYWLGRVYFEMNDIVRGCAALASSRAAIAPADVELRNQVDYAWQRCPADVAATAAAVPVSPARPTAVDTTAPRRDSTPTTIPPRVVASAPAASAPARVVAPKAPPAATDDAQRFSVQVAAYGTAAEAQRLVKKYRTNGYDARVSGTVAPFRVRIGQFKTRAEAVDLAKVLKAKSGAAFVVAAEPK